MKPKPIVFIPMYICVLETGYVHANFSGQIHDPDWREVVTVEGGA